MWLHCNGCLLFISHETSKPAYFYAIGCSTNAKLSFKKKMHFMKVPSTWNLYSYHFHEILDAENIIPPFCPHTIYVLLKLCVWKTAIVCFYFPFIIKLLIKFQQLHRYELSLLFFGIQSSPEIAYDEILTLLCIHKFSLVSNMLHNLPQERKAVFCFKHNSKKHLK